MAVGLGLALASIFHNILLRRIIGIGSVVCIIGDDILGLAYAMAYVRMC